MVQGTSRETIDSRGIDTEIIRARKRSAFEVIEAILRNIDGRGTRKTILANRAMLDYKVMDKYLNLLLGQGMVKIGPNGRVYITEKGRRFLEQYQHLKEMIKEGKEL